MSQPTILMSGSNVFRGLRNNGFHKFKPIMNGITEAREKNNRLKVSWSVVLFVARKFSSCDSLCWFLAVSIYGPSTWCLSPAFFHSLALRTGMITFPATALAAGLRDARSNTQKNTMENLQQRMLFFLFLKAMQVVKNLLCMG
jgi:hypothetical protein